MVAGRTDFTHDQVVSGTLEELLRVDFGPPLHSLVLAGHMHELEEEMFHSFAITEDTPLLKNDDSE